jgi:hypothetical protein
MPLLLLLINALDGEAAWGLALVGGVIGALVFGLITVGQPWFAPRRFGRRLGVGLPVTWTFTPQGVQNRSEQGTGTFPWSRVDELARGRGVLAMLISPPLTAVGLPETALTSVEHDQLTAWWRSARAAASGAAGGAPGPVGAAAGTVAAASGANGDVPGAAPGQPAADWPDPPEPGEVVVHGVMTLPLMRAMQWSTGRTSRRRTLTLGLYGVMLGLVAVFAVLEMTSSGEFRAGTLFPVALLVALPLLLVGLMEASARRVVGRLRGRPVTWRAGAQGLHAASPLGAVEVPWSRFETVTVRRHAIVLRTGVPRVVVGIPTESLSAADIDRIVGPARAAGATVLDAR